jgi:hypothetical protein
MEEAGALQVTLAMALIHKKVTLTEVQTVRGVPEDLVARPLQEMVQ